MIPVIFINCSETPFVDEIMNGSKKYETRTRNTLKSLMDWSLGERVLIAETGHGDPVVRCSVVIDYYADVYMKEQWDAYFKDTGIEPDSKYDWKTDTKKKVLYHLSDVKPVEPFYLPKESRRHGRVWAEYDE